MKKRVYWVNFGHAYCVASDRDEFGYDLGLAMQDAEFTRDQALDMVTALSLAAEENLC